MQGAFALQFYNVITHVYPAVVSFRKESQSQGKEDIAVDSCQGAAGEV